MPTRTFEVALLLATLLACGQGSGPKKEPPRTEISAQDLASKPPDFYRGKALRVRGTIKNISKMVVTFETRPPTDVVMHGWNSPVGWQNGTERMSPGQAIVLECDGVGNNTANECKEHGKP